MSDQRGKNIGADRRIGEFWERQFCKMAAAYGRSFTPHQIGHAQSARAAYLYGGKYHTATLPDVTLWTRPGEHHEIKHKDPTRDGEFGLERYRVNALHWFAEETGQSVYYTIHNYSRVPLETRSERKRNLQNDPRHWVCASILDLVNSEYRVNPNDKSIVNGRLKSGVEVLYWRQSLFVPLMCLWFGPDEVDSALLKTANEG